MRREVVISQRPAEEAARRIVTALSGRLETQAWATLAVSGGSTPGPMFDAMASSDLAWPRIGVLQVDERIAPRGDEARNLTSLQARLLDRVTTNAHPLAVEVEPPAEAARRSQRRLRSVAGAPPTIDVIHLGIGADGHTASLVPGDPVLAVDDRDVADVAPYEGHRRLTLTAPVLSRAALVVWLVVGDDKREALERLLGEDPNIPATLVTAPDQVIVTDLPVVPV